MTGPRHRIRRQILEVTLGEQDGAWQLQSELARIQRACLEAIIDRCCTEAGDPERIHRIGSIEVNLGVIERDGLERCLIERLPPLLINALSAKIREADDAITQDGSDPEVASRLELLALFARTGNLPWWADAGGPDVIDVTAQALLQRAPAPLIALMRTLARERDQLRRVVRHCHDERLWGLFRGLLGSSSAHRGQRGAELGALLVRVPRVADTVESKRALWAAALRAASVEGSAHEDSVSFWRAVLAHVALELAVPFVALVTRLREERSVDADPAEELLLVLARELRIGSAVGSAVASGTVIEQGADVTSGATGEDRSTRTVEGEEPWDDLAGARRLLGEAIERARDALAASPEADAGTVAQVRAGGGEVEASDGSAGAGGLLREAREPAGDGAFARPGDAESEARVDDVGALDELAEARRLLREASERVAAASPTPPGTSVETEAEARPGAGEVEAPDELAGARGLVGEASQRANEGSPTQPGTGAESGAAGEVEAMVGRTGVRRSPVDANQRGTAALPVSGAGTEAEVRAGEFGAPDELAGARRLLRQASERVTSEGTREVEAVDELTGVGELSGGASERAAAASPTPLETRVAEARAGTREVEVPDELARIRRLSGGASERAAAASPTPPETRVEAEAEARAGTREVEVLDELTGAGRLPGEASERATAVSPTPPGTGVETEAERSSAANEVKAPDELAGARRLPGAASERVAAASSTPPGTGVESEAEARFGASEVGAPDELAGARRLSGDVNRRTTASTPSWSATDAETEAKARVGPHEARAPDELAGARRLLGDASERAASASLTPPGTDAETEAATRPGASEVEAPDKLAGARRLPGDANRRATAATPSSPATDAETAAEAKSAANDAGRLDELVAARRFLGETVERTTAAPPASPESGAETDTQARGDTREIDVPDELAATRMLLHAMLEPATAPLTPPGTDVEARGGTREVDASRERGVVAAPDELAATRDPSPAPEVTGMTPLAALPEPTRYQPARDGPGEAPRVDVLAAGEMNALEVTLTRLERSGIPAPNLVAALRGVAAQIPVYRRQALIAASRDLAHLGSTLGPVAPRTARSFTAWLHQVIVLDILPSDALVRGLAALESLKERQARTTPTPKRPPKARASGLDRADDVYVENAGMVVLWPFLGPFFDRLGLMTERRFNDERARCRAVGLLQHVASGDLDPPEYQLVLAKVLCGMGAREEFDFGPPVTEVEAEESADLLAAIIANAPILGEMSIDGLRGSFLLRKGMLGARDAAWLLRAERASYDVVLDRLPWSFGWVKLPWMEVALCVEW